MAFVNEKNVSVYDEDKQRMRTYDRTIDHERGLTLTRGKSWHRYTVREEPNPGDPIPEYFLFKGEDFQVRFEGIMTYEELENGNSDVFWTINHTWDLEGIEGREQEIAKLLEEAMKAYGVYFGKSNVRSVTVTFGKHTERLIKDFEFIPTTTLENN